MKTTIRIFILILFLGIFTNSCKEDAQPNQPSETEINYIALLQDNNQKPVINAVVNLYNSDKSELIASDTSDEDGMFSFNNLKTTKSNLQLEILHKFYSPFNFNFDDLENNENNIITLEDNDDCCGLAELSITDEDGNPINGVEVKVRQEMRVLKKEHSDDKGKVVFKGLCLEEFEFRLAKEGYKVIEELAEIESCEKAKELSFKMISTQSEEDTCCKGIITFKPKDKDGNILNGTKVYIYKDGKLIQDPVVKDGKAVEDGLCDGKYTIVYKREGYEDKEVNIELDCNEEKTVEHTLDKKDSDCCDAILKFIIQDKSSKAAIEGAKITLKLDGKVIFEKKATDNEGEYLAKELCKGKYTVIIEKEGYKRIETSWNVEKCETLQEHFGLEKENDCCKGILTFKPKDKDGNILNGTKVYIYKDGKLIQDPVVKDGKAIEDGLCDGKYTIVYKREGYEDKEVNVELDCNEEKTVDHTLVKKDSDCCDAILKFIIQDKSSKTAIEGAKITLKLDGKVIFEKKATDNEGEYLAKELCKGNYTVIIEKDGYNRIETSWNVEKCETLQEHFGLEKENDCCKGVLIFKPKDKDGNILNGTKVYIYKDGKIIQDPVVKDGKAIEDGLCDGKYTIVYKREGYEDKEVNVELDCNEEKTVDHTLVKKETDCCDGFVRVKVKDEDGNLLKNKTVRLWKGNDKIKEFKTDANGVVEYEGLCEGNNYSISIISEDYEGLEFDFDLGCNKEITFEKTLKSKEECCDAILKFIVKDNDTKSAIEGAKITLKLNGKVIYENKSTDKEGEYLAKELCKGNYTVIIEKDGYNRIETSWKIENCYDFQEHFWMKK